MQDSAFALARWNYRALSHNHHYIRVKSRCWDAIFPIRCMRRRETPRIDFLIRWHLFSILRELGLERHFGA
jgi:hypothetical protein